MGAPNVVKYTNNGITCYRLELLISQDTRVQILSSVRLKLISILLELEKHFVTSDTLDINNGFNNNDNIEEISTSLNSIFLMEKVR